MAGSSLRPVATNSAVTTCDPGSRSRSAVIVCRNVPTQLNVYVTRWSCTNRLCRDEAAVGEQHAFRVRRFDLHAGGDGERPTADGDGGLLRDGRAVRVVDVAVTLG